MIARKSTIRDVSQLAGVSISTVSRVLNNREKARTIPAEVRKRVLVCAEQLNYVPNANARRVFTHRSGIIGLLVPSHTRMNMHIFEDGHLTRLISGVEAGIENSDFRLLLIFNDKRFMDDREYMSLIQSQNIDGLLVWGAQPSETFWQEPVEAGLPIMFAVTVPGPLEQYNYTINATRAGTRKALELLASHGHRRILQLHETHNAFLERQMDAGIADFLRERPGITIDVQDIRSSGDEIAVPLFRRPGAPTAVLAYNYSMGVEAYGRLAEAGIRVPDEIEIVSCYSYQSRKSWVSTVVVDDYEIGRTAVKNLQKLIESPDRRLQAEIPFSFFFGQTTRNAADVPTPERIGEKQRGSVTESSVPQPLQRPYCSRTSES